MEEQESQVVYKVVGSNHLGAFTSFAAKVGMLYGRKIVSRAPAYLAQLGYDLLAFSDIDAARRFLKVYSRDGILFVAIATGVRTTDLPPMLRYAPSRYDTLPLRYEDGSWPKGTVMCKTIELVKRVRK